MQSFKREIRSLLLKWLRKVCFFNEYFTFKLLLGLTWALQIVCFSIEILPISKKRKVWHQFHLEHGSAKSLHTIIWPPVTPPKSCRKQAKKEAQLWQYLQIASNVFGWSKFLFFALMPILSNLVLILNKYGNKVEGVATFQFCVCQPWWRSLLEGQLFQQTGGGGDSRPALYARARQWQYRGQMMWLHMSIFPITSYLTMMKNCISAPFRTTPSICVWLQLGHDYKR